jgi:hypothetical protein
MVEPSMTPSDKDTAAEKLARRHYEIEAGVTQIFILEDKAEAAVVRGGESRTSDVIRLLEVNRNTPPSGEVIPLGFGPMPASGIRYPSVIVEVTPQELEDIKANRLPLPNGWSIGPMIPRPEDKPDEQR